MCIYARITDYYDKTIAAECTFKYYIPVYLSNHLFIHFRPQQTVFIFFNCLHFFFSDEPTITLSTAAPIPVREGSNAVMSCTAEGNPTPQIMWLRFNYRLGDNVKHLVEMYAAGEMKITARLTVTNTTREDSGRYRCLARNKVGQLDESIRVFGKLYDKSIYEHV